MSEIDFLPERLRQQRQRKSRLKRQGCLLVLCLLAMAALTYVRQHRISEARAGVAVLQERRHSVQNEIALIAPLERQLADLMIKKRIDGELGSRTDCTAVLAELCRVTPANVSLRGLEIETAEVKGENKPNGNSKPGVGEPPLKRVRVKVEGLAPTDVDIANFIGQLSSSCLFEDVNMGYSKSVPYRGHVGREFEASCYLAK